MTGYIRHDAPDLFGYRRVVACGDASIEVAPIAKSCADALICAHHYSGSVAWASSLHLGVYCHGRLSGALQFGPAMNPASGSAIVSGTAPDEWLELNRMWLTDEKPANAGTRAIAYALRLIRHLRPRVRWVQTFADSRCGKHGAIYQAASFVYCGSHSTTFYELDGQWFHQSLAGRRPVDKRGWGSGPKARYFNKHRERAVAHTFEQYRYIRFLHGSWRSRLLLPVYPYPKPGVENPI